MNAASPPKAPVRPVLLKNGEVFRADGRFSRGDVLLAGDRFGDPGAFSGEAETIDAAGLFLIPGLTDIHFHGCAGRDFCEADPAAIRQIVDYEERAGVTTICPATMTLPGEQLLRIARAARDFSGAGGAALIGIRMEGPFLSEEKCGAQNRACLALPDPDFLARMREAAGGLLRILDIAPELPGALSLIAAEKEHIKFSLAHTAADYETARKAFTAGASHMTHLYNAMPQMAGRAPGPIAAAADTDSVTAEIICDGVHVHPAMVRQALRLFGEDRIVFISDSMEATGMPDGAYSLGGQPVIKEGKHARLADGTIAASVTDLMGCLRTAVREMGIPLATAVKCAAVNPAKCVGIYDRYGSIETGKCANLVALDQRLSAVMIFNRGRRVL